MSEAPFAGDYREDGSLVCNLCGEPGGICVCGFRDAAKVRKLANKVAALEQERDAAIEQAQRMSLNVNRVNKELARLRKVVRGIKASAESAAQVTPDPRAFAGIIERCDRALAAEGEPCMYDK